MLEVPVHDINEKLPVGVGDRHFPSLPRFRFIPTTNRSKMTHSLVFLSKKMMPLPSVRDFVARLATSQEWNRVHDVRVDSRGGLPTPGSFFFSLDRSNAQR